MAAPASATGRSLAAHALPGDTGVAVELISATEQGFSGGAGSGAIAIRDSGRLVFFLSLAGDLVPGDTNGEVDLFVRDRESGQTELLSGRPGGPQSAAGEAHTTTLGISMDARFVAFSSTADDLSEDDSNGFEDVYLLDRDLDTLVLVSANAAGVAANGHSFLAGVSADGKRVVFQSEATDFGLPDTNLRPDVFVRDLDTGEILMASVNMLGTNGGNLTVLDHRINAEGTLVAFTSLASDLVEGDDNGSSDVFVRDLAAGQTRLVSRNHQGNGSANSGSSFLGIATAANRITFSSRATDLVEEDVEGNVDIFIHDLNRGETALVSRRLGGGSSNGDSFQGVLSEDGRFVAFPSVASDLVPRDTNGFSDVFLHDAGNRETVLASVRLDGRDSSNSASFGPALGRDGRFVAFFGSATDLGMPTSGIFQDVFVFDAVTGRVQLLSVNLEGSNGGNSDSRFPFLEGTGGTVAFTSLASDLAAEDLNGELDAFAADPAIFRDGFESGDAAAWSASVGLPTP